METIDAVVTLAKNLLTKHGRVEPPLLIQGTTGETIRPLPDAAEPVKLSLCEAIGFALARAEAIGELTRVFLLAEGWRSKAPATPGLPATQPKYDPDRVDVLLVFAYDVPAGTKRIALYDELRDGS